MKYKEPVVGIEPTAGRLRSDYSTTELHRLVTYFHEYSCGVPGSALDISDYTHRVPPVSSIFSPGIYPPLKKERG